MIYSQKNAFKKRNISKEERQKLDKLKANKQTRWMIGDSIR
jgi:hypothetical protein